MPDNVPRCELHHLPLSSDGRSYLAERGRLETFVGPCLTPPSVPTAASNTTTVESKGICDRCKKPVYVERGQAWHSKEEKVWHEVCSVSALTKEFTVEEVRRMWDEAWHKERHPIREVFDVFTAKLNEARKKL